MSYEPTRQPDSQPADDDQPRYRARRRRTRHYGEIIQRRFWETCIHVALQTEGARQAIENADRALEAWRERWDKPAPAEPEPRPVIPLPPGFIATPNFREWTDAEKRELRKYLKLDDSPEESAAQAKRSGAGNDFTGPIDPDRTRPHPFKPVEGNRYCGDCGAGRLHSIHTPETAQDAKAGREWHDEVMRSVGGSPHSFSALQNSEYCASCGLSRFHPVHPEPAPNAQ